MSILNLDESARLQLTKTELLPDPRDPSTTLSVTYLCDLGGNRLQQGQSPLPVFRDVFTGKYFVQVAEKIPSANDTASVQLREELEALKPIHYVSSTGTVNGFFVPAPEFSNRAGVVAEVAKPQQPVAGIFTPQQ